MRDKTAAFLGKSKHLGVAVMYGCSLIRTDGLDGFRDGLQLIRSLLEQHWAQLYPQLDPEDNNDPTQRLNLLGTLTAPRGSVSGWLRVVDYLYAAELCRPKPKEPGITFEQLLAVRNKLPGTPDASKLSAAIAEVGNEVIAARHQVLTDALEAAKGIDQSLANTLGAGNTIGFEALQKCLEELISMVVPYLAGGAVDSAETSGDGAQSSSAAGESAISVRGAIKSRDDVVRVIDSICDFYRQVEPGSPVPYVLRRAQTMVKMNFVEMVHELGLGTAESLRPSMGSALDSATPPAPEPPAES